MRLAAVRAYLAIESDSPLTVYTGKLVKTLLYTVVKELRLYRGLRGIVSPIHISPLFTPGRREWELGELVTPRYRGRGGDYRLEPVTLNGEYMMHVGGVTELVEKARQGLERLRTPLQVKLGDSIVVARLEKIEDVTRAIAEKNLDASKVTLYLKAPVKLFNVFTASRLPKFNISAVEVLMTPYMLYTDMLTMSEALLLEASRLLGLLVETYYSLTTVKYIQIPLNDAKDPGMIGKITYIIDTAEPSLREKISNILIAAEIAGIGESRTNGFGTTTWQPK